jgi:hypothetical protein
VIVSLVASTLWHVVKIYPLTCERILSRHNRKFGNSCGQGKWVRRETYMSDSKL